MGLTGAKAEFPRNAAASTPAGLTGTRAEFPSEMGFTGTEAEFPVVKLVSEFPSEMELTGTKAEVPISIRVCLTGAHAEFPSVGRTGANAEFPKTLHTPHSPRLSLRR